MLGKGSRVIGGRGRCIPDLKRDGRLCWICPILYIDGSRYVYFYGTQCQSLTAFSLGMDVVGRNGQNDGIARCSRNSCTRTSTMKEEYSNWTMVVEGHGIIDVGGLRY